MRITLLTVIGTSVSAGVALGGFHSQAGWLFFLAVSLGLMMASHRLRLFVPRAHWTGWRMRPHSTVEGAWGKLCMPT